jgi:hypothetical protein
MSPLLSRISASRSASTECRHALHLGAIERAVGRSSVILQQRAVRYHLLKERLHARLRRRADFAFLASPGLGFLVATLRGPLIAAGAVAARFRRWA